MARIYKTPTDQSEEMEKETSTNRYSDIKRKIEEVVDQYNTDATSKIKVIEFDDGTFVEKYDSGSIDFSKPKVHEGKDNQPFATFTITGGLNGKGEWTQYLEDLKKTFESLEQEFDCLLEIEKIENDIADDVWTAEVLLYKKEKDNK